MQATDGLGPVSFPSSYGEYADVRIGVICNYAPDDELDDNGNPTLHFQRDAAGNFYNATIRNLFTTMQTMMCHAGFFLDVGMMILLASVAVMDVCMLMGPTSCWSETIEYRLLPQFQLPLARNIIACVLHKCKNLVGVMVFGHSRQHPAMVAHELLSKVSDSERVSQPTAEHPMALHIRSCPKLRRDVSFNHESAWGRYSTT